MQTTKEHQSFEAWRWKAPLAGVCGPADHCIHPTGQLQTRLLLGSVNFASTHPPPTAGPYAHRRLYTVWANSVCPFRIGCMRSSLKLNGWKSHKARTQASPKLCTVSAWWVFQQMRIYGLCWPLRSSQYGKVRLLSSSQPPWSLWHHLLRPHLLCTSLPNRTRRPQQAMKPLQLSLICPDRHIYKDNLDLTR